MLGKDRAQQIFQNPESSATIFNEERDLNFYDEYLKCEPALSFSSIIASHIRLSWCNRATR